MAFSPHIGTKWCHDFPKLARESGFYFNRHKSKVRVDWNRINSIDVDRIIRERDFYSIDDNINNVIDYCLESEYDVKILDPNFVKLFRLAQLAVEYLLYCKQYLDHSVIILKDELKSKIEENVKLKKEITTLEETIKHLKEKTKERNRLVETKIGDCSGEIYKCPHCPKSFISSMFVSAHIVRRHAHASDLYMPASPMHEHYRNETEKLHNEIKNLKERLNETEKVIRNESERVSEKKAVEKPEQEVESFKHNVKSEENQEYKGYQEEIKNLKTMLFDEIHNLRQKEKTMYEHKAETNVQTLINQQEKEFQKLKNQLLEKLNPDIESMHTKLYTQENYWKSKIEQLENQHHNDIERLTMELKLTQKIADNMKVEYESKVSDLERQTANQSNILIEQSKQLHSLSNEINVSQLNEKNNDSENNLPQKYNQTVILNQSNETGKKSDENEFKKKPCLNMKTQQIIVESIDGIMSSDSPRKEILLALENKLTKNMHALKSKTQTIMCENKRSIKPTSTETIKDIKFRNENSINDISESEIFEAENDYETKQKKQHLHTVPMRKIDLNESGTRKLESSSNKNISHDFPSRVKSDKKSEALSDDLSSETNSELSVSDTLSETESVTTIHNNYPSHRHKTYTSVSSKPKKTTPDDSFYKKLQINLKDVFEQKLRDLGIDPEWQGIPKATFKQKMDILKHHQKIVAKKFPKYDQIKLKIIKEVVDNIPKKDNAAENFKHIKKSHLYKSVTDVKLTAVKTLTDNKNLSRASTIKNTSNNFHSTLKNDHSIRNIVDNESSVKHTKTSSTKPTEKLIQISSNPIESPENIQRVISSQESSIERSSFNRMKSLFNSEEFNSTPNYKDTLNNKSIESNRISSLKLEQELGNVSLSPKLNKSVLKSATGSTSSLMKKKVIFDLGNEKDNESLSDDEIKKEESLSDYDMKEEELNNNWNSPGTSDERKHSAENEIQEHSDNIILKTSQSDKIAEISRKLEAQLSMVRQKPVGSVETIFSSTYKQGIASQKKDNEQINSISRSSFLENQLKISNSQLTNDLVPPLHNVKENISENLYAESVSDISDLDSDIDKILKLE